MQGWKRALEPLNSFPFNFFCFARNSAKFPHSPPSLSSSPSPQPPTLRSIETSPPTPFPTEDGVMRTRSLWRPLQMEIRLQPSQRRRRRREIAERRPPTRLSRTPSLPPPFPSAIKIALLDGPLYDPVFQNISVIGSGGSGFGTQNERAGERGWPRNSF